MKMVIIRVGPDLQRKENEMENLTKWPQGKRN